MTTRRKIRVDDLFEHRIPGDVQLSADPSWVVWTERSADRESGKTYSHLVGGRLGAPVRQLTFGKLNDTAPRLSPDGSHIAFSRKRQQAPARRTPRADIERLDGVGRADRFSDLGRERQERRELYDEQNLSCA